MNIDNALIVSAIIFAIGLYGALSKRSTVVVLMSIELMFNGVILAALAFSRFSMPAGLTGGQLTVTAANVSMVLTGQVFAIFIITVGAAEIVLGIALVLALYRSSNSIEITAANSFRN